MKDVGLRERDTLEEPLVTGASGEEAGEEGGLSMAIPLQGQETDTSLTDPAHRMPDVRQEQGERAGVPQIETSHALVVTDFATPSVNPVERLVRVAYRLGVPGATLVSPFRKPARMRLLATVDSPLAGERAAGVALRAGHFLVYGVKAPIAQVDFKPGVHLTPPFERTIHGFTWLADLAASAPREQCVPTAERVLGAWLEANKGSVKGAAWQVELAGLRLLNWLIYAPLLLGGKDEGLRKQTLDSISATARWLDRNIHKAPDRLAEVTGWCAIVASGLLLPDGKPRRLYGEAGLVRAMGDLVSEDGGVLSRSPIAQMEAIAALVQLSACYRSVREDPPQPVVTMLELLVPPLLALTHDDGSLGSWQGSAAIDASALAALIEASGVRARPLKDVRQWGYQRIAARKSVLQFDAAPPPVTRHARYGCASTLAFEFSVNGERLIVNCGGAAMTGGQVPVRIEQGLRATAAHSTLVLDNANSTAVKINGKLGSGVGEVEVDRRVIEMKNGRATRVEASHDGYCSRYGLSHQRILILRDSGDELRGEDLLIPVGRKLKHGKVDYAIRFHIGPGVDISLTDDRRGAGLAVSDGSFWQFRVPQGELAIEESLWVDGQGKPVPIQQLVIQGMVSRGGGSFSWLLKKIG
ncbi:MAG: heparinase II/III family protein [Sphingomonadaceae bacterium]